MAIYSSVAEARRHAAPPRPAGDDAAPAVIPIACFASGTHLATADGEVAADRVQIGDLLRTRDGALSAVTWVGYRRVDCLRHPRPVEVWPVRIRAGAFGAGRPRHDVLLSPNHVVVCGDSAVPARCLIDGELIRSESVPVMTWWHVALSAHAIVLADGLAVECFADVGDHADFDNGGTVVRLHPDFWSVAWEMDRCLPLVLSGPRFAAARRALRRRAGGRGNRDA